MVRAILESAGKFAGGVARDIASEKALTAVNYITWKGVAWVWGNDLIAEAFNYIEDADANQITGISPLGVVESVKGLIDSACKLAVVTDRELAQELFGEMVQEGISNAIQTSLGGALQTIWNTLRGSLPAMPDYVNDVGENLDSLDDKLATLVASMAGTNIPTAMFDLVKGANRSIENRYRSAVGQVELMLNFITNEFMSVIGSAIANLHNIASRVRLAKMQAAIAYNETFRRIAEEHLARLNEIQDTLEGVYEYYQRIEDFSPETALYEFAKLEAEFLATQRSYNEFKQSLLNVLQNAYDYVDSKIPELRQKLFEAYEKLFDLYYDAFRMVLQGVSEDTIVAEIRDRIQEIYESIVAYRDAWNTDIEITTG